MPVLVIVSPSSITIDRSKVGVTGTSNTTLSNFPLLFSVTDADLADTSNGGKIESYDSVSNDPSVSLRISLG